MACRQRQMRAGRRRRLGRTNGHVRVCSDAKRDGLIPLVRQGCTQHCSSSPNWLLRALPPAVLSASEDGGAASEWKHDDFTAAAGAAAATEELMPILQRGGDAVADDAVVEAPKAVAPPSPQPLLPQPALLLSSTVPLMPSEMSAGTAADAICIDTRRLHSSSRCKACAS